MLSWYPPGGSTRPSTRPRTCLAPTTTATRSGTWRPTRRCTRTLTRTLPPRPPHPGQRMSGSSWLTKNGPFHSLTHGVILLVILLVWKYLKSFLTNIFSGFTVSVSWRRSVASSNLQLRVAPVSTLCPLPRICCLDQRPDEAGTCSSWRTEAWPPGCRLQQLTSILIHFSPPAPWSPDTTRVNAFFWWHHKRNIIQMLCAA